MRNLIFVLLFCAGTAYGQHLNLRYTPYAPGIGGKGVGATVYLKPATDAACDSIWAYLAAHYTISGVPVLSATEYYDQSSQQTWSDPYGNRSKIFEITPASPAGNVLQDNGVWGLPYVAGTNVTISGNTISASGGSNPTSTDSTNSASGAITIGTAAFQYFNIQYNGVGSYTIAAPTYAQEGITITIIDLAAHADTITCATDGFNAKGSSGNVVLTGATIGDNVTIHASDQHWIVTGDINGTIN